MPLHRPMLAGVAVLLTLVAAATPTSQAHGSSLLTRQGADALGAIVGRWQSDTTNGASAVSDCAWTPSHDAVVCEQAITAPDGPHHTVNLYAYDAASGRYAFYGLQHVGDAMEPVRLAIAGSVWIYGGAARDADGRFSRTVNDFSARDRYTWRLESSPDGEHWTAGMNGRSVRVTR